MLQPQGNVPHIFNEDCKTNKNTMGIVNSCKVILLVRKDTQKTQLMLCLNQLQSHTFNLDQNDLQARSPIGYTVNLKLRAIKNGALLTHKKAEATLPLR